MADQPRKISELPPIPNITGIEELAGVHGDTYKLTIDQIVDYGNEETLTGTVTKTLAIGGGDFSSMNEVFDWIAKTPMSNVELIINVLPGTHVMTDAGSSDFAYKLAGSRVSKIAFNGSDSGTCVFAINNSSPGKGFLSLTNIYLEMRDLRITINNQPANVFTANSSSISMFNVVTVGIESLINCEDTYVVLNSCNISSSDTSITASASKLTIDTCSFDGNLTAVYGIHADNSSSVIVGNNSLLANFGTALRSDNSSKIILGSYSLTNNTTDYNPPLNQLQGDGGYITNGSLTTGGTSGDVLEFLSIAEFPVTGEGGKIYVANDTNLIYRWNGIGYEELSPSEEEVLEYNSTVDFPNTGQTGKLYIATDTNLMFRWNGASYTNVAPPPVNSVAGKTGDIILGISDITGLQAEIDAHNAHIIDSSIHFLATDVTQVDVGLDQVDNTADAEKNINGGYF